MVGSMLAQGVYFAYKAGADLGLATVTRTSTGGYRTRLGLYATKAANIAPLTWDDLDSDGIAEAPRLLIEGARTNAYTAPEDFTNVAWTKTRTTITANDTTAPDGVTASADKLVEDSTASNTHFIEQTLPAVTNDILQAPAIFMKAAERSWVHIFTKDKANVDRRSWFNLLTGQWGTTDSGHGLIAEQFGAWWRIGVRFDVGSGGTTPRVAYGLSDADASFSYNGDGSSGAYIWGASFTADERFHSSYHSGARTALQIDSPALIPLHKSCTLYAKCRLQHGVVANAGAFLDLLELRDSDGTARLLLYRAQSSANITWEWRSPSEGGVNRSWTPPQTEFEILARHDATDHHLELALDGGAFASGAVPTAQTKPFSQGATVLRFRDDAFWAVDTVKVLAGLHSWASARSAPTAVGI